MGGGKSTCEEGAHLVVRVRGGRALNAEPGWWARGAQGMLVGGVERGMRSCGPELGSK